MSIEISATQTALVAGGAGFVGSHLCRALLDAGFDVICVDNFLTGSMENLAELERNERFQIVEADICHEIKIDRKVHQLYNLACVASPKHYQMRPVHTLLTNVQGTANLLALAEKLGAKFVQASTSEVYGNPAISPQVEEYWGNVNCIGPRACYDEGKRAAEALCFDIMRARRVDVRVARIFNTYGPRMRPNDGRVISNMITQAICNLPLTVYGNGDQTRSFCYISDLVDGLSRLMNIQKNPAFPINIGNPQEVSIRALAQLVLNMVQTGSEIDYRPLPVDDPERRRPDITKASEYLGWTPKIALHDGLRMTIEWFKHSLTPSIPQW